MRWMWGILRSLPTVRCGSQSFDDYKPFSYLTKIIRLQVIGITPRDDDIMKTWVIFDVLENDLPSPTTGFLR